MEQKQNQEKESFLGEEFIDEEETSSPVQPTSRGGQQRKMAESSSGSMSSADGGSLRMESTKIGFKAKSKGKPLKRKVLSFRKSAKYSSGESSGDLKNRERSAAEVTITSAKVAGKGISGKDHPILPPSSSGTISSSLNTHSPVDPWGGKAEESGFFKEASTWKAMTAIAIILLVFSVFTQGFQFSGKERGELSPSAAQQAVTEYVNTNLLQPPFVAEASAVERINDLYKVTLEVAGQSVDSYLTRDGKFFFPQGFVIAEDALLQGDTAVAENGDGTIVGDGDQDQAAEAKLAPGEESADASEGIVAENAASEGNSVQPSEETAETASESGSASEGSSGELNAAAVSEPLQKRTLEAKKWFFSPHRLNVQSGIPVELVITSPDLIFTFAIPRLGVSTEVDREATVSFIVEQAGEYPFSCSSCEDWRGMTGILVVE